MPLFGSVVRLVIAREIGASQVAQHFLRRHDVAAGVRAVHGAHEFFLRDEARRRALLLQLGQEPRLVLRELGFRERRIAHDVGSDREDLVRVVAQAARSRSRSRPKTARLAAEKPPPSVASCSAIWRLVRCAVPSRSNEAVTIARPC